MQGAPKMSSLLLLSIVVGSKSACVDPMFTHLNFENAFMVRSNLGGQGGKCTTVGVCDELQSASTPHEMYIRNVATGPNGERIDLRVTNATEYRASRPHQNGLVDNKKMGKINLYGPQNTGVWDSVFTG